MKTLIISDTHLSTRFEPKKFEFLQKLINEYDQIIINGDFWDTYLCSFKSFLESKWKLLFPILKSKKTIYIHGNHDPQNATNKDVLRFCDLDTHHYQLKHDKQILNIIHGHQIVETMDMRLSLKLKKKIFGLADNCYNAMTRIMKERFWELIMKKYTYKFYDYKTKYKLDSLICAHTHCPSQDSTNFINSGMINYGLAHYVKISKDVQLIKTLY